MSSPATPRGRPLDPEVGAAALRATLELLDERGYGGLRVSDVAARAGIGLGALYRRWDSKRSLVVSALRSAAAEHEPAETGDPVEDLVAGLSSLAEELHGRAARLLAVALSGEDPELAAVVREAKIVPRIEANRARTRRALGEPAGAEVRADLGLGLILLGLLADGDAPSAERIRAEIVPRMLG
ncbi:MAG TPA: TetR/AcrR family transcriptional regulator [Solirubrobacterales bacterium]|jgi:AcrR family transcriptional regulator